MKAACVMVVLSFVLAVTQAQKLKPSIYLHPMSDKLIEHINSLKTTWKVSFTLLVWEFVKQPIFILLICSGSRLVAILAKIFRWPPSPEWWVFIQILACSCQHTRRSARYLLTKLFLKNLMRELLGQTAPPFKKSEIRVLVDHAG